MLAVARRSAAAFSFAVLHLLRDPSVLEADPLEELVVVDEVVEARRGDEEREDVRGLLDVDRAHARLEDGDGLRVLGLELPQAARLLAQALREALEARLLGRELGLELLERALGLVDGGLRGLELRDDRRELRREHALALLRRVDLGLERGDPRVDRGLLALDVVARRRRGEDERQGEERRGQRSPTHQP